MVAVLVGLEQGFPFPKRLRNAELAWAKNRVTIPSMERSGNVDAQKPLFLERLPLELTIELPVGSKSGTYELELKRNSQSVLSTGGKAQIRNGTTASTVKINLSEFEAGDYSMVIR